MKSSSKLDWFLVYAVYPLMTALVFGGVIGGFYSFVSQSPDFPAIMLTETQRAAALRSTVGWIVFVLVGYYVVVIGWKIIADLADEYHKGNRDI